MKIFLSFLIIISSLSAHGQLLCGVKYNGKWGFINTNGNWHIEAVYDSVGTFYDGYADVILKEGIGVIDSNGIIVLSPDTNYKFVGDVHEGMVNILMNNDKEKFYSLKLKKFIPGEFEEAYWFSEGLAAVQNYDEKWGFIDYLGVVVIDYQFNYVDWYFENDSIEVEINEEELYINKIGEVIGRVPAYNYQKTELTLKEKRQRLRMGNPQFESLSIPSTGYRQDSVFWFCIENKYGLADTSGKIIIEPIYDNLLYFAEGFASTERKDKWGYINPKGEEVIEFKFNYSNSFKHGLAAVKINNLWGFINHTGEWEIPPKFEATNNYFRNTNATFDPIIRFAYE